jgi:hypothetical protein
MSEDIRPPKEPEHVASDRVDAREISEALLILDENGDWRWIPVPDETDIKNRNT